MQSGGNPLDAGVEMVKGTSFGIDTGEGPERRPHRQDVGTVALKGAIAWSSSR